MSTPNSIVAVVRNFQAGATYETFDHNKCEKGFIEPIKNLLSNAPNSLQSIVVVSCCEDGSKFAEELSGDLTPTLDYVRAMFPTETASKKIITQACANWGLNAGSANALNVGLEIAKDLKANKLLCWSPSLNLDGHRLYQMDKFMDTMNLKFVGLLREKWYAHMQWNLMQNTCGLWDIETLKTINGFNPECNGDGVTKISTIEYGEVPLAGMEDFEAYLRASKQAGEFMAWGHVEIKNPAKRDLSHIKAGSEQDKLKQVNIARQGAVIEAYAKKIYPDLEPCEVIAEIMQKVVYDNY